MEAALLQALQSQRRALLHLLRGAAGRELERARIVFGFSASGLQQCLRLLLAQNYAPAALCIAALQMAMAALAGARGSACWGDACVDELSRALAEADSEVALARFVGMAAQGFRQASGVAVAALRVRALLALEGMRSQTQPALLAAQRALATLPTQAQHRTNCAAPATGSVADRGAGRGAPAGRECRPGVAGALHRTLFRRA